MSLAYEPSSEPLHIFDLFLASGPLPRAGGIRGRVDSVRAEGGARGERPEE